MASLRRHQFAVLVAVTSGWIGARLRESANSKLSAEERRLAYAKDALVGLVAATGLGTAAEGMRFARMAPDGAVPLRDGDHAAPTASESARRSKRRVNLLSTANLVSEIALVAVNAALAQEGFRRPLGGGSSRAGAASSRPATIRRGAVASPIVRSQSAVQHACARGAVSSAPRRAVPGLRPGAPRWR